MKTVLVTGGAGFIGAYFVRHCLMLGTYRVVNVDALTYAGDLGRLDRCDRSKNYEFEKLNIANEEAIGRVFQQYQPEIVVNFAAETHVDRSIQNSFPLKES